MPPPLLSGVLSRSQAAAYWFNLLPQPHRGAYSPVLEQVLATASSYNRLFPGIQVFVTGSSLNLKAREHNDIDLMVVIPARAIIKIKGEFLSVIWKAFQAGSDTELQEYKRDPRASMLGVAQILKQCIESNHLVAEIRAQDREALMKRTNSQNEVNRILMDPAREVNSIATGLSGTISQEQNNKPVDTDGTQGYQFGPLVESFLSTVAQGLDQKDQNGTPLFGFDWNKSFSEGYDKTASENNLYIYTTLQCPPVHLFLTTELNSDKVMQKKESFMLEYFTPRERMQAVKLM